MGVPFTIIVAIVSVPLVPIILALYSVCTRLWSTTTECGMPRSERGHRKAMKIGSLALTVVALSAVPLDYGIRSASATDFCVELTATEFNRRLERRGDDNACAGSDSATIKSMARERARDNANSAIASQCLNNVTADIGNQACTRVNLIANSSPNDSWVDTPPAPKPNANKVKYIGQGIASGAAGMNLCAMAHDLRLRTRNVVDGHCPHDSGLLPHRTFATARAWARCAVICSTP